MFDFLIKFIRQQFGSEGQIPLHAPVFVGAEKQLVLDAVESTFVSSVGAYVGEFEEKIRRFTNSAAAVAVVNGTAALHVALRLCEVGRDDLVVTQPLTFVATCNAIRYCGADPVFVDVDRNTLGLSPASLAEWLENNAYVDDEGVCRSKESDRRIRACVPMHTLGHPADLAGLRDLTNQWQVSLIEDAAEALGSYLKGHHVGTAGRIGVVSFNGNKILTTGGGGMLLLDQVDAIRARHLTTTAKIQHEYEYVHDAVGFNYRMPNLNAALGCAQFEMLHKFLQAKRKLAQMYEEVLQDSELQFIREPPESSSNYWLNGVVCKDRESRDELLRVTNGHGVCTRPIWALMTELQMYKDCESGRLDNATWVEQRVVCLPSSVIPELMV